MYINGQGISRAGAKFVQALVDSGVSYDDIHTIGFLVWGANSGGHWKVNNTSCD